VQVAILVDVLVHLRVDDDLQAFDSGPRTRQLLDDRRVMEFVETAQQRIVRARVLNETDDRIVEVARQPVERGLLLGGRGLFVRRQVVELELVRLAARDPAIEEDVVVVGRVQRLGADLDRNRRGRPIEVLRLSAQRLERIDVVLARLRGEVVPDETLYGMIVRAHQQVLLRVRHDRPEHLEARHRIVLVRLRIESIDRESKQPLLRRGRGLDAERDGVDARDREQLEAADRRGFETHRALLDGDARSLARGRNSGEVLVRNWPPRPTGWPAARE
jgi:hypothetical protein